MMKDPKHPRLSWFFLGLALLWAALGLPFTSFLIGVLVVFMLRALVSDFRSPGPQDRKRG